MRQINGVEGVPAFPGLGQGVVYENGLVQTSGMVGVILGENPPRLEETVEAQVWSALTYTERTLDAAGSGIRHIGMLSIYHTNPDDYGTIAATCAAYFEQQGIEPDKRPARKIIGAFSLPLGAFAEIETTAEVKPADSDPRNGCES